MKKEVWAGNMQLLVGSRNRNWTGKRRPMADGRRRQPGQAIGCCQWAAAIGSGQEREGQRQKVEKGSLDWTGNRKLLVGSSNRKWSGKRRPKAEGRRRQPGMDRQ